MADLESNCKNFLPINRKEKFYTATILPQIICYDNFKYINTFLNLINNFPKNLQVNPDSNINNIQFITEFCLKESVVNTIDIKWKDAPVSKETPDLVILITEPELYLIVVEGKMFSSTDINEFKEQIKGQKKVIDCIKKTLNINDKNIHHIGLIPEKYFSDNVPIDCQILFWEDIIRSYENIFKNNYFLEMLKISIKNYGDLVSNNETAFGSFGKNAEEHLTGSAIMDQHNSGKKLWVGRDGGLRGDKLKKDKEMGEWENRKYEVNYKSKDAPNRNWFSSKDFVDYMYGNNSGN